MVNYDSDSSADDEVDYTETSVLLGYASNDITEDVNSYLGGVPSFIHPSSPPPTSLIRCKVCSSLLVLLLQLNGDLPDKFPGHERRLYVLTCRRKACSRKDGSIRVLRGIRVPGSADTATAKLAVGEKSSMTGAGKVGDSTGKGSSSGVVSNTAFGDSLFGAKPSSNTSSPTAMNPFAAPSPKQNPFGPPSTLAAANPFSVPSPALQTPILLSEALPPASPSTYDSATNTIASTLPQSFAAALSLNQPTSSTSLSMSTSKDMDTTKPAAKFGPPEPYPPSSSFPMPYPKLYLDASYEALDAATPASKTELQKYTIDTGMDLDVENGSSGKGEDKKGGRGGKGEKEDKDTFESSIDGTFQKFADRLAQNPEQVLRYEFEGAPLLYSKGDGVGKMISASSGSGADANVKVKTVAGSGRGKGVSNGVPSCNNCGADRVFELQMTPHAILELEDGDEYVEDSTIGKKGIIEGMEWGTLIVAVCSRDCAANVEIVKDGGNDKDSVSRVGWAEEWVGVQWEEDIAERR